MQEQLGYYPGETNLRAADVVIINKLSAAAPEAVERIRENVRAYNPRATLIEGDLEVSADSAAEISGRRVIVVEDGPTLTHGGMAFGAGSIAAKRAGAREVVDPRNVAVGSIAAVFRQFPHIGPVLPAMGYSPAQRDELARTIAASNADLVVDASPAGVAQVLELSLPVVRVHYRFVQLAGTPLLQLVERFLGPLP